MGATQLFSLKKRKIFVYYIKKVFICTHKYIVNNPLKSTAYSIELLF